MIISINYYQRIIILLVAAISIFAGSAQNAKGQEKSTVKEDEFIYPNPQNSDDLSLYGFMAFNCELARARMELVLDEAYRKKDSVLIVILRLEAGERAGLYEFRRKDLASFLERYYILQRNYTGKYVIALGDRVKEIGRAGFYIGGKLARPIGI